MVFDQLLNLFCGMSKCSNLGYGLAFPWIWILIKYRNLSASAEDSGTCGLGIEICFFWAVLMIGRQWWQLVVTFLLSGKGGRSLIWF